MKKLVLILLSSIFVFACATTGTRQTAKEQDEAGAVTDSYHVTGTSADNFLRSSAELYVNFRAARILLNRSTKDIKNIAISHEAANATSENLSDAPTQRSIDILKAKKSELKAEELQYIKKGIIDLIQSGDTLNTAAIKAKDLLPQAADVVSKAKTELTGIKATKIPKVISGVDQAKNQLNDVVKDAPIVAKEILILAEAFKALAE